VNFVKRLRDEMKFADIGQLKRQIQLDIEEAVRTLTVGSLASAARAR